MSGNTHVDQAAVQELRNIMGSDFPLLVQTFVRDSTLRIESARAAFRAGDHDALRRAAHSFKGSAGNMGALQLADLCRSLEMMARDGDMKGVPTVIDKLVNEYGAVELELNALLR